MVAVFIVVIGALLGIVRGCQQTPKVRYFLDGQVIVTGRPEDLDSFAQNVGITANLEGFRLVERLEFRLPPGIRMLESCMEPPLDILEDGQPTFVIDHYHFTSTLSVEDAISRIRDLADQQNLAIVPEPNLLTGRPPAPTSGDPWSGEGSPWSGEGSPSGVEAAGAAHHAFRAQWALGITNGIGLMDREGNRLIADTMGERVRVGVFDTSPFPPAVSSAVFSMTEPLTLALVHPVTGFPVDPDGEAADVRNHGLFVAGLVHVVAPKAEIQLIRVLDNTGQGDLQTLNRALRTFISETLAYSDTLNGAVINLSLGVHPPPDAEYEKPPEEVVSLSRILTLAKCLNFSVVAASGNDSAKSIPPLDAQRPASWNSTVGVAASNMGGKLACFSNDGEIAAPGGDGEGASPVCKQVIHKCVEADEHQTQAVADYEGCRFALISLSLNSDVGYSFWNGTSFAAPLVSGVAALILEAQGPWLEADKVYDKITGGVITPPEVINVQSTLQ